MTRFKRTNSVFETHARTLIRSKTTYTQISRLSKIPPNDPSGSNASMCSRRHDLRPTKPSSKRNTPYFEASPQVINHNLTIKLTKSSPSFIFKPIVAPAYCQSGDCSCVSGTGSGKERFKLGNQPILQPSGSFPVCTRRSRVSPASWGRQVQLREGRGSKRTVKIPSASRWKSVPGRGYRKR